jgi:hypothetical protein
VSGEARPQRGEQGETSKGLGWGELLAGKTAQNKATPFDEAGRAAFEKGLRTNEEGFTDEDITVKVKTALSGETCGHLRPFSRCSSVATKA